jgi:hypothetical protein
MGIDALTIDWHSINCWFVSPAYLVARVIRYMRQCTTHGAIILPLWKSANNWPILSHTDEGFTSELKGCID